MRDDVERLKDILEAIAVIDGAMHINAELHQMNELEFLGIVRCVEVIGEAARAVSDELKTKYANIPWREIIKMRNVIVHQYFEVEHEKVEIVVKRNLPELKLAIEKIIEEIE